MLRFSRKISYLLFPLLLTTYSMQSFAYLVLSKNRIVIEERDKSKAVEITNTAKNPFLVQLTISSSLDEDNDPKTPFFISPPIFILPGEKTQRVRVALMNKAAFPTDRESLSWFHYTEIAPNAAIQPPSQLKFSVQNVVKLFYRPSGIKGNMNKMPEQLTFTATQKSNKNILVIHNPSGYHADFGGLNLRIDDKEVPFNLNEKFLLAPFSSAELVIPRNVKFSSASEVKFDLVNDYGGKNEYISKLATQ